MRLHRIQGVLVLAILFCILFSSNALTAEATVKYSWEAPVKDMQVEKYRVEMRFGPERDGTYGPWGEMGTTSNMFFDLTFTKGLWYQVRVRAEEVGGGVTPYSPPSEPFRVSDGTNEETGEGLEPMPPEDIKGPEEVGGGSG